MLDRIDIHIEFLRVDYEKFQVDRLGETGDSISKRVQVAMDIQSQRFFWQRRYVCRGDKIILLITGLQPEFDSGDGPDEFIDKSLYTAQGHRVLKLEMTITDLAGSDEI